MKLLVLIPTESLVSIIIFTVEIEIYLQSAFSWSK